MSKKNNFESIKLKDVDLKQEEEIRKQLLAEKSHSAFWVNKIVFNLKSEIRKLFYENLNIEENYFCLIDKYSPEKIRTINFDNADNSIIYKLKTDFVNDKLGLMSEIIYEIDINGFYVFNNFFMRDTLLTKNSFPMVQTLDINLKLKTTEENDENVVIENLKSCLKLIAKAAENVRETYEIINPIHLKNINYDRVHIMKFSDYFTEQKNITKDDKIESLFGFYSIVLFRDWKKAKSKHFADWFETGANINYKLLGKFGDQIYDFGYINIFKDVHLMNIVLSWNSILLVLFGNKSLSKLLNIPDSLMSTEEK